MNNDKVKTLLQKAMIKTWNDDTDTIAELISLAIELNYLDDSEDEQVFNKHLSKFVFGHSNPSTDFSVELIHLSNEEQRKNAVATLSQVAKVLATPKQATECIIAQNNVIEAQAEVIKNQKEISSIYESEVSDYRAMIKAILPELKTKFENEDKLSEKWSEAFELWEEILND